MNDPSDHEFNDAPIDPMASEGIEQLSAGDAVPVGLSRRSPAEIQIEWSDGKVMVYKAGRLRAKCPCATCRERRRGESDEKDDQSDDADASRLQSLSPSKGLLLPVLSAAEAKPDTIESLKPIGNYAYNIVFGDGHRTGLFTLDFLYHFGEPIE